MSRMLRSRAIPILRDNGQPTAPTTSASNDSILRQPLSVINNDEDVITVDDVELEQELKGLKALYKTALGAKKKRRQRKMKVADIAETLTSENLAQSCATNTCLLQDNTHPLKVVCFEGHSHVSGSVLPATKASGPQELVRDSPKDDVSSSQGSCALLEDEKAALRLKSNSGLLQPSPKDDEQATWLQNMDNEASFVRPIIKDQTAHKHTPTNEADNVDEDSFVEQIISRTPARLITSTEQPLHTSNVTETISKTTNATVVEYNSPTRGGDMTNDRIVSLTLDRANITKESERMPVRNDTAEQASSRTSKHSRSTEVNKHGVRRNLNPKTIPGRKPDQPTSTVATTTDTHAVNSSASISRKVPVKRPTSLLPPKQPAKSSKPPTRADFELPGEAIARRLKEQREARTAERMSNAEQMAVRRSNSSFSKFTSSTSRQSTSLYDRAAAFRSNEESTRPEIYELPGEALSRRKRQAHETKLKAQEEEEKRRRQFRAKPNRSSMVGPEPRETIASLARRSHIGASGLDSTANKRNSMILGLHTPSTLACDQANVSAPRARQTHLANTARRASIAGAGVLHKRPVSSLATSTTAGPQHVFNRGEKTQAQIEQDRREREEGAKRARAEAAEKGREASRRWAEQQRAKSAAVMSPEKAGSQTDAIDADLGAV